VAPAGEVKSTPNVSPNRSTGRIITDTPLDISKRNPVKKKQ